VGYAAADGRMRSSALATGIGTRGRGLAQIEANPRVVPWGEPAASALRCASRPCRSEMRAAQQATELILGRGSVFGAAARKGPGKGEDAMAFTCWRSTSTGRGRAALALLVIAGVVAIGGVRAPVALATNPCNPNGVGQNYYGEVCQFAPSGGEFVNVGGYAESSALIASKAGQFVDNDMWIVQPGSTLTSTYWVETGIITSCCNTNFEFFWEDHRPGQGAPSYHDIGPAQSYTQYFREIWQEDSTDWGVYIGGNNETSTNSTMDPSLIRTGTEEAPQGAETACSEQSSLDYQLAGQQTHTGWNDALGNAQTGESSPPYVAWQSLNNWAYDWSGSSESGSACASSLGFTPSLSPATNPVTSPAGLTDTSPASSPSPSAETGTPLTESQITQTAQEFAARMGDSTPTSIEHVEGTRQQTVLALTGDKVSTNPDVYAIVMQGNFVANNMPVPAGVSAPSGSVLTLVIDASTGQMTDFSIGSQVPDLASLGPVTIDQ
jgi:hypothetical protein